MFGPVRQLAGVREAKLQLAVLGAHHHGLAALGPVRACVHRRIPLTFGLSLAFRPALAARQVEAGVGGRERRVPALREHGVPRAAVVQGGDPGPDLARREPRVAGQAQALEEGRVLPRLGAC